MNSGNGDKDGPTPPDDERRSIMLGRSPDGEGATQAPKHRAQPPASASSAPRPATPPEAGTEPGSQSARTHDEDSPELAEAVSALVAGQRRVEAQLADQIVELGKITAHLPDLRALSGKIDAATEWANSIKAGTEELLATNSRLIEGLKGGRHDLDKTIAELGIQKESLAEQLTSFDKGMRELRGLWKRVDERTQALEKAEKELAGHYENWAVGGTDLRRDVNALSERLGIPLDRQASRNAPMSRCHVAASKSVTRNRKVPFANRGKKPMVWRARRWAAIASSVTGRKARMGRAPQRTGGLPQRPGFHSLALAGA